MGDEKIVFKIIDKATGKPQGVYSRSYHDEFEFSSKEDALNANCHGIHRDESRFRIVKYRVTYEEIDDGDDNQS